MVRHVDGCRYARAGWSCFLPRVRQPVERAGQRSQSRSDEQISKSLRAGAAGDYFRTITEFEAQSTIDRLARDDVVQVNDGRAVYATKVLWIESLLELI